MGVVEIRTKTERTQPMTVLQHKQTKRYLVSVGSNYVETTKMLEDAKKWNEKKAMYRTNLRRYYNAHKDQLGDFERVEI